MSITHLIVAVLAVWEIVEIWRHGAIFATWRARTETWDNWVGDLLACGFCLAPWVAWLVLGWIFLIDFLGWPEVALLPVYGLAVAGAANLLNDLSHGFCRTPKAQNLASEENHGEAEDEGGE